MGLLQTVLRACGRAACRVGRGAASSVSTEPPYRVQMLLEDIARGEFGGLDYNETSISTCWIKLRENRRISARWYSDGTRSELRMQGPKGFEWIELPYDKWSEMILRTIILKARTHQDAQLEGILDV